MNDFLWGVYPYLCLVLFFAVPLIRMRFKPFSWSSRASSLFSRRSLGVASLLLHWGLLLVLIGHLVGLFGGLLGSAGAIEFFYWIALFGGTMVLAGSVLALARRIFDREVRAMSQSDDYLAHVFFIPIVILALYQVVAHRIFGISYAASSWVASLWAFTPQPELMASASVITQLHVFLALTFLAYFPFTKLVHVWTYPINYFVRPYQSMRTMRYRFERKWEFSLRSDKSWLVYALGSIAVVFLISASMLGKASSAIEQEVAGPSLSPSGHLMGSALYVSQCARCHGVTGDGDGPGANSPTFPIAPRDLTQGLYAFVSTTNRIASDEDLARTIREGIISSGMPAFDRLNPAQIDSLVSVLDAIWRDRPEVGPRITIPPSPPVTQNLIAMGATVYTARCATCHDEEGHGTGPAGAVLDPPPRDFSSDFKAGNDPEQLYLRVAAGIPPYMTPMAREVLEAIGAPTPALTHEEIWAVVHYTLFKFVGSNLTELNGG